MCVCVCVRMYIMSYLESNVIDLLQYCIEKVIEVFTFETNINNQLIILLCIYSSPCRNFGECAVQLDLILKFLYKPKWEVIICGNFNIYIFNRIDFCSSNIITHLQSYKFVDIIDFPTETTKYYSLDIDNILIL